MFQIWAQMCFQHWLYLNLVLQPVLGGHRVFSIQLIKPFPEGDNLLEAQLYTCTVCVLSRIVLKLR